MASRYSGKLSPAEGNARLEVCCGDVFDALHELGQIALLAGSHGRETDAAVAHHGGRNPVPRGRTELGVPVHLTIEMSVDVDESRRHDRTVGVDLLPALLTHSADPGDRSVLQRNVRAGGLGTGSVDDETPTNHEIMHGCFPRRVSIRCLQGRLSKRTGSSRKPDTKTEGA